MVQNIVRIILFLSILLNASIAFSKELTVLSYNIWELPIITFRTHKPLKRGKALAKFLKENPRDIMGIQELFSHKVYRKIKRQLRNINYQYTARPKARPFKGKFINSGLAIFSKYPIEKTIFETYKNCTGDECLSNKGVQAAIIKISDTLKVYVVNTHMQSGDTEKRTEVRMKQISQMKNFLKRDFFSKNYPIIFTGDFNTYKHSVSYNHLITELEIENIDVQGDIIYSYDPDSNNQLEAGSHPAQLLDYVFIKDPSSRLSQGTRKIIRPRGDYSKFKNRDLSDHFAIEAKIQF